jgi:hypothetical protein
VPCRDCRDLDPERRVRRARLVRPVAIRVVGRAIQRLGEQTARGGQRDRTSARLRASDAHVLVVADMDEEPVLGFESAPRAVVTQHGAHQFTPDVQGDPCAVVVGGEVGREQPVQHVAVDGRLDSEVDDSADREVAHGQLGHAGVLGERRHGGEVGGLHWTVVAGHALGPAVRPLVVAIGGSYLMIRWTCGALMIGLVALRKSGDRFEHVSRARTSTTTRYTTNVLSCRRAAVRAARQRRERAREIRDKG